MMLDMKPEDKELLYLCAKAVGYEIIGYHAKIGLRVWNETRTHGYKWNPLYDDGDAFRLAVKLKMNLSMEEPWGFSSAYCEGLEQGYGFDHEGDPLAATRRAVVTAAAEIGKLKNE